MKTKLNKITMLITTTLLVLSISNLGGTLKAKAAENSDTTSVEIVAEKLDVKPEELTNLQANVQKALERTDQTKKTKDIQVSENIQVDLDIEDENVPELSIGVLKATKKFHHTTTATLTMHSNAGTKLGTLKGVTTFRCNGNKSIPTDAYTTYKMKFYSISSKVAKKSGALKKSYTRMTFKGKLKVGSQWASLTLDSFNYNLTIYCTGKGKGTATWTK